MTTTDTGRLLELRDDYRRCDDPAAPANRRWVRERAGLTVDELAARIWGRGANMATQRIQGFEGGGRLDPRYRIGQEYVRTMTLLAEQVRGDIRVEALAEITGDDLVAIDRQLWADA